MMVVDKGLKVFSRLIMVGWIYCKFCKKNRKVNNVLNSIIKVNLLILSIVSGIWID